MIRRIIIIAASLFVTFGIYAQELKSPNNPIPHKKSPTGNIKGKVTVSGTNEIIDFATVYINGTSFWCTTNEKGEYNLSAPTGKHSISASATGYNTSVKDISVKADEITIVNFELPQLAMELEEVTVTASGVGRVKKSAYNAVALDTRELQNSAKNLSDALVKLPGMKLRESGGVGSDMQIMLDGFSGKHVKVFIDGVPQEGSGESFDLNNIPVNFAERVEVYKGVVPVGFGADAIGGVINIVTNKNRRDWYLDASYSYGSFNTHKSNVTFGQTLRNGFTYEINAYQNYSDNDYYIDNWVEEFNHDNNTSFQDETKIRRVKRFNDTYHNEAVIGKVGLTDKKWADRLMVGFMYSHFYKEIQTGVYQRNVFGQKHRHGHTLSPTLEYQKRDLFTKGLNVSANVSYHDNLTTNVDTASYRYNWLGDRIPLRTPGEQSYLYNEQKDRNWNAAFTASYRIGSAHLFMLNHVLTSFERTGRSLIESNSQLDNFDIPTLTRKNITGLSYRLMLSDKWNMSVFGKYYDSHNKGAVQSSSNKKVYPVESNDNSFGYGAAGTYFLFDGIQFKLSYEKALRLPSPLELFGDGDLEVGKANLRPEKSHNFNFNAGYERQWGAHGLFADFMLIYRNTDDYIMRGLSNIGGSGASYGFYENHGRVETKGFNVSLRYSYDRWLNLGGTFNYLDARDKERKRSEGSGQNSLTYNQRIPNQPYMFANYDINLYWHDLFAKGNTLSLVWDGYYQHSFPLHWENLGDAATKFRVPQQISHNLTVSYSVKGGRYNFSFECRNITDAKLYDNFSLQRAGRGFYGKVRVCFGD